MRKIASSLLAITAVVAASLVIAWNFYFKERHLDNALVAEANGLLFTQATVSLGPSPADWETRAFLPASAISQLADALSGVEYVSHQGRREADGRYDGSFVVTVNELRIDTAIGQMRPKFAASIRYDADRTERWWGDIVVDVDIDAVFVPVVIANGDNMPPRARLAVVPKIIRPVFNVGFASIGAGHLLSEVIAAGVFEGLGDQLVIDAPVIDSPLKVTTKIQSTTHSKFEVNGGYDLTTSMPERTYERQIRADLPIVVSSGLWIVGNDTAPPVVPAVSGDVEDVGAYVDQLRSEVATAAALFERTDDQVEVRISNKPLMAIAAEIRTDKDPMVVAVTSALAEGRIAELMVMKDNTLGDIGVSVRPRVPDFVTGAVRIAPPSFEWVPGSGLATVLSASADVKASVDVHLSTSFVGGGIGKDVDIFGSTSASLPAKLSIAKRSTPYGEAVVIQPELACREIEIEAFPATREDIIKELWIAVKPVGVRIKRNLGGGRHPPSTIIDTLATVHPFGRDDKQDQAADVPRAYFHYRGIEVAWSIGDVVVEETGLLIKAGVKVRPSTSMPGPVSADDRDRLRAALEQAAPEIPCLPGDRYELLLVGGGVAVGSNHEVVKFVLAAVKAGERVFDEAKKEVEKFTKYPFDTVVALPQNIINEGTQAIEKALQPVQDLGSAAGDVITDVGKGLGKAGEDVKKKLGIR